MAAETATVMSMVVANDAMAEATAEEVLGAMGAAEPGQDMVATEGAVAMATAAVATTTTTSRHTVFKAGWLSIFLCLLASTH
jgi:hypothetical protein